MAQKSLFKTSTVSVVVKKSRAVYTGIVVSPTTVGAVTINLRNSTDTFGDKVIPTGIFLGSSAVLGYAGVMSGFEVEAGNGLNLEMSTGTGAEVTVYYRND
jgi:hypothetical protein